MLAMRPEHEPHQEGTPVYGPNWVTVGRCTLSAQQWLDVDVYCCPDCGKLEFYRGEKDRDKRVAGQSIAQVKCSRCGGRYDLDSCKCPFCGEENDKLF